MAVRIYISLQLSLYHPCFQAFRGLAGCKILVYISLVLTSLFDPLSPCRFIDKVHLSLVQFPVCSCRSYDPLVSFSLTFLSWFPSQRPLRWAASSLHYYLFFSIVPLALAQSCTRLVSRLCVLCRLLVMFRFSLRISWLVLFLCLLSSPRCATWYKQGSSHSVFWCLFAIQHFLSWPCSTVQCHRLHRN